MSRLLISPKIRIMKTYTVDLFRFFCVESKRAKTLNGPEKCFIFVRFYLYIIFFIVFHLYFYYLNRVVFILFYYTWHRLLFWDEFCSIHTHRQNLRSSLLSKPKDSLWLLTPTLLSGSSRSFHWDKCTISTQRDFSQEPL